MGEGSSAASPVTVTLLLAGGHRETLVLTADDPLLRSLLAAVRSRATGEAAGRLFQLPTREGRGRLYLGSGDLVGVATEPPVVLPEDWDAPPRESPPATPRQAAKPLGTDVLPSQVFQLDGFFSPAEHRDIVDYAIAREAEFVGTQTSTGAANYRESVVLHHFPELADQLRQRIRDRLPEVQAALKLPAFATDQIEAQLTAHNDGHFYKIHNDNGSPETATRELTYVYYFYRSPKPFSGGELRVYDSKIENNFYVQADSFQTVEPRNNSIVFFLSRYMHEVLPVRVPSRAFQDSRFTVNGWIRRRV